ncbi:hypothetical protein HYH03_007010 [Edaphochlamys debaryana]|uniref:DNA (cytosine-5-)-methyltransferase n=1 Tax=Edaphochlamys debaryana TaxID=47281 RepID=A0A835Y9B5_9CHLO|nr:hypothetical protein HYH03_007010 [Edaphochlamys debaryana]|eukprot:KAG2494765.1 hypothetical protein HYH03_007010 [Edaphochlamys debaryana]
MSRAEQEEAWKGEHYKLKYAWCYRLRDTSIGTHFKVNPDRPGDDEVPKGEVRQYTEPRKGVEELLGDQSLWLEEQWESEEGSGAELLTPSCIVRRVTVYWVPPNLGVPPPEEPEGPVPVDQEVVFHLRGYYSHNFKRFLDGTRPPGALLLPPRAGAAVASLAGGSGMGPSPNQGPDLHSGGGARGLHGSGLPAATSADRWRNSSSGGGGSSRSGQAATAGSTTAAAAAAATAAAAAGRGDPAPLPPELHGPPDNERPTSLVHVLTYLTARLARSPPFAGKSADHPDLGGGGAEGGGDPRRAKLLRVLQACCGPGGLSLQNGLCKPLSGQGDAFEFVDGFGVDLGEDACTTFVANHCGAAVYNCTVDEFLELVRRFVMLGDFLECCRQRDEAAGGAAAGGSGAGARAGGGTTRSGNDGAGGSGEASGGEAAGGGGGSCCVGDVTGMGLMHSVQTTKKGQLVQTLKPKNYWLEVRVERSAASKQPGSAALTAWCALETKWRRIGLSEGGLPDQLWVPVQELLEGEAAGPQTRQLLRSYVERVKAERRLPRRGDIDVVAAGPPCQNLSQLNRKVSNKNIMADAKNRLVFAVLDLVEILRPAYVVLEQVLAAASKEDGVWLREVQARLLLMDYQQQVVDIAAADHGAPEGRQRIFVLAAAPGRILPPVPYKTHAFTPSINDGGSKLVTLERCRPVPPPGHKLLPRSCIADAISGLDACPRSNWALSPLASVATAGAGAGCAAGGGGGPGGSRSGAGPCTPPASAAAARHSAASAQPPPQAPLQHVLSSAKTPPGTTPANVRVAICNGLASLRNAELAASQLALYATALDLERRQAAEKGSAAGSPRVLTPWELCTKELEWDGIRLLPRAEGEAGVAEAGAGGKRRRRAAGAEAARRIRRGFVEEEAEDWDDEEEEEDEQRQSQRGDGGEAERTGAASGEGSAKLQRDSSRPQASATGLADQPASQTAARDGGDCRAQPPGSSDEEGEGPEAHAEARAKAWSGYGLARALGDEGVVAAYANDPCATRAERRARRKGIEAEWRKLGEERVEEARAALTELLCLGPAMRALLERELRRARGEPLTCAADSGPSGAGGAGPATPPARAGRAGTSASPGVARGGAGGKGGGGWGRGGPGGGGGRGSGTGASGCPLDGLVANHAPMPQSVADEQRIALIPPALGREDTKLHASPQLRLPCGLLARPGGAGGQVGDARSPSQAEHSQAQAGPSQAQAGPSQAQAGPSQAPPPAPPRTPRETPGRSGPRRLWPRHDSDWDLEVAAIDEIAETSTDDSSDGEDGDAGARRRKEQPRAYRRACLRGYHGVIDSAAHVTRTYAHPTQNRLLTPRELMCIHGFALYYVICTALKKQSCGGDGNVRIKGIMSYGSVVQTALDTLTAALQLAEQWRARLELGPQQAAAACTGPTTGGQAARDARGSGGAGSSGFYANGLWQDSSRARAPGSMGTSGAGSGTSGGASGSGSGDSGSAGPGDAQAALKAALIRVRQALKAVRMQRKPEYRQIGESVSPLVAAPLADSFRLAASGADCIPGDREQQAHVRIGAREAATAGVRLKLGPQPAQGRGGGQSGAAGLRRQGPEGGQPQFRTPAAPAPKQREAPAGGVRPGRALDPAEAMGRDAPAAKAVVAGEGSDKGVDADAYHVDTPKRRGAFRPPRRGLDPGPRAKPEREPQPQHETRPARGCRAAAEPQARRSTRPAAARAQQRLRAAAAEAESSEDEGGADSSDGAEGLAGRLAAGRGFKRRAQAPLPQARPARAPASACAPAAKAPSGRREPPKSAPTAAERAAAAKGRGTRAAPAAAAAATSDEEGEERAEESETTADDSRDEDFTVGGEEEDSDGAGGDGRGARAPAAAAALRGRRAVRAAPPPRDGPPLWARSRAGRPSAAAAAAAAAVDEEEEQEEEGRGTGSGAGGSDPSDSGDGASDGDGEVIELLSSSSGSEFGSESGSDLSSEDDDGDGDEEDAAESSGGESSASAELSSGDVDNEEEGSAGAKGEPSEDIRGGRGRGRAREGRVVGARRSAALRGASARGAKRLMEAIAVTAGGFVGWALTV